MAYAAITMLTAFSLRLVPELISPRYPVGYDTASYAYEVPHVMERAPHLIILGSLLFHVIAWALLQATSMDVYSLLKVLGPLTYGFLALSFYVFLRSALSWSEERSLLCSLLCSLQVPTLRLSWDLFKSELGLAMFFLFAATVRSELKHKWILAGVLAFLTVLSHQLAAIMMFVWSAWELLASRDREMAIRMALALLPSAVLFSLQLALYYKLLALPAPSGPSRPGRTIIYLRPAVEARQPRFLRDYFLAYNFLGASYYDLAATLLKLLAVCYLPLLPLAFAGARRDRAVDPLMIWPTVATFSVLVLPSAYPFYSFFRWLLLLVFPMAIYATSGLLRLKKTLGRYWRPVLVALMGMYLAVAVGYASGAFSYVVDEDVNAYMPRSLVESTIGINQIDDCITCLEWLSGRASNGSVLIAEQRFYPWALQFLDARIAIALYPHGYPIEDVPAPGLADDFSEIYLIWYSGGQIDGFREAFSSGDVAIYEYEAH